MCLERISSRPTPKPLIESGWKQFSDYSGSLRFPNQPLKGSAIVPLDAWLTAEERTVTGATGGSYQSGFHIWTDEVELAKKFPTSKMRRVYFRNVHTIGEQDGTVVVAREMYVPSDPDAWPPQ